MSTTTSVAAEPRAALVVRGLRHRFREREVLRGLDIEVRTGEIFGVLGPNGSGKSTLLSVLSGLLLMQSGDVILEGQSIRGGARRLRELSGVVFQSPSLDPKLTAEENLILAARIRGLGGAEARRRAGMQLAAADLADRARENVERFSGGMKRRLDIARALIHEPRLLIMDEPTAGLDEAAFRATWDRLEAIRRATGLSILLATHRPEEAERCDRLAIITGGRIGIVDTPQTLRRRLSGDVVVLRADDVTLLKSEIETRFGRPCLIEHGELLIECERGHELVPRLVEAFPAGRLDSVSLRHPNLADVFLKMTGHALEDDEAAGEVA